MNKITELQLGRPAYVYIRQSTQFQVEHNLESQRRQYALAGRARELGWKQVEVIDEDLGRSGSGTVERKGFDRLVAAVCLGEVGAVFCLEASRLARNNRDWHQLVDLCGLVGTLIIDPDGTYDARQLNDRLLLGLKGTMSEFELGILRQRSLQALKEKAKRGELYTTVPIGYLRTLEDRCEQDPDQRIRQAIRTVFEKFEEMGSVRQVLLWFRQETFLWPMVEYGSGRRRVEWRLPVYNTILKVLTNPIYAGAYAYGRTITKTHVIEGRARKQSGVAQKQENWEVLIVHHHEGYIPWERYQRNQARIQENSNMKGLMAVRGAARSGKSLVAGLLRCAHCGRKLHVSYSGYDHVPRYACRGAAVNHGGAMCISFGGLRVDEMVEEKVLEIIQPAMIEASMQAAERQKTQQDQKRDALVLALEQARYEADRAFRQYDAIEPENRLVAGELEKRWNTALEGVTSLEKKMAGMSSSEEKTTEADQKRLLALSEDLPAVWFDERSDMRLKKRIVRTLIEEIIVDARTTPGQIGLLIHWTGGLHNQVSIQRNQTGQHRFSTDKEIVELVRELAAIMPDREIARILNRLGRKTTHGNTWIQSRVTSLRNSYGILIYDPKHQKEMGLINMAQAAERLGISPMSVLRLIQKGIIHARQVVPCAPRLIEEAQLKMESVQRAAECVKLHKTVPLSGDSKQASLFSSTEEKQIAR